MKVSEKDGSVIFKVCVVPRASRSEIVGEHYGALKIRIASPPVEGAANTELIKLLARQIGVSRSSIEITSGQTSKTKQVRIAGMTQTDLNVILKAKT